MRQHLSKRIIIPASFWTSLGSLIMAIEFVSHQMGVQDSAFLLNDISKFVLRILPDSVRVQTSNCMCTEVFFERADFLISFSTDKKITVK
jgi:hypothetical protein